MVIQCDELYTVVVNLLVSNALYRLRLSIMSNNDTCNSTFRQYFRIILSEMLLKFHYLYFISLFFRVSA